MQLGSLARKALVEKAATNCQGSFLWFADRAAHFSAQPSLNQNWVKAEELGPVRVEREKFDERGFQHSRVDSELLEEQRRKQPRRFPTQKSRVIQDFKTYIADKEIPDGKKSEVVRSNLNQVKDFNAKTVANVFHACRKGNFFDKKLFAELAKKTMQVKYFVSDLTSIEMSMMIQSLGVLTRLSAERSKNTDKDWKKFMFPGYGKLLQNLIKECLFRETTEYRRSDTQGIGNIVHGLGLILSYVKVEDIEFPARQIVNLGMKKMARHTQLKETPPQSLACMLQGCAALEIKDHQVLDIFCTEIARRLQLLQDGGENATVSKTGLARNATSEENDSNKDNAAKSGVAAGRMRPGVNLETWMLRRKSEVIFPNQSLGSVVWSLGKLEHYHESTMEIVSKEIFRRLSSFHVRDLIGVLQGLVALEHNDNDLLDALCEKICEEDILQRFSDESFATAIHLLGELRYRNSLAMDRVGTEACKPHRVENLGDRELNRVIEGLAMVGYQKRDVLGALFGEMFRRKRLENYSSSDLMAIVRSVHRLKYMDAGLIRDLSSELVKLGRLGEFDEGELLQILRAMGSIGYREFEVLNPIAVEMIMQGRLHRFSKQGLADMAFNLGKLKYKDKKVLRRLSGEICSPNRLRDFNPMEMGRIIRGFGESEFFYERVAVELLKRMQYSLSSFTDPRDLSGMVRSLAYVKNEMGPAFISIRLAPFLEHVCSECTYPEILELFGLQSSMVMCWGLSQLRYHDRDLFDFLLNRFVECAEKGSFAYQPEHVLVALDSCTRVHHRCERFVKFVGWWLNERLEVLKPKQVVRAMWGLTAVDSLDETLLETLCSKLVDADDWEGVDWGKVMQILYLAEEDSRPSETEAGVLTSGRLQLLELASEKCERPGLIRFTAQASLEVRVRSALDDLGVSYLKNVEIEKPWLMASTVLKGTPLAIEISQSSDYSISKSSEVVSHAAFRDRLLRKSGHKVLRLSSTEILKPDGMNFTAVLKRKLKDNYGIRI
ncbi:hypothetical protein BSKO_12051 [Bryopsis sp. KO-2023]|nr:hypothetical protein BSKO_12051 [Bryopsis sp. KO-2023]